MRNNCPDIPRSFAAVPRAGNRFGPDLRFDRGREYRVHAAHACTEAERRLEDAEAERRVTLKEFFKSTQRAAVPMGMPIIIFGGIFTGWVTVTEAARGSIPRLIAMGMKIGPMMHTSQSFR